VRAPRVRREILKIIGMDGRALRSETALPIRKRRDAVAWCPRDGESSRKRRIGKQVRRFVDFHVSHARNEPEYRPRLAEHWKARLEFRSLKCRKPVLPGDLRVHEFDERDGNYASRSPHDSLGFRWRAANGYELTAHPNDLRAIHVEVDLAGEGTETRRA